MADFVSSSTTTSDALSVGNGCGGRRTIAQALADNTWAQVLEIAIVFAPALFAIGILRAIRPENPLIFMAALWLANLTMLALIWLGIRVRGESCRSIGLSVIWSGVLDAFRAILKSIPIAIFAIAAFVVGTVIMANVVGIPESADMTKFNYLQGNLPMLLASLVGVYIVSSFGEEVVYRGFLITRLERMFPNNRRPTLFALAISSAIFGLAHIEWGPMGIAQTTCMGAAFGISFLLIQRKLWPLVLAHAYMDTLLLLPLYLAP